MSQQKHTEVLIIGGDPAAGVTFCRKMKKLKPETKITMLRPEKRSMALYAGA